MYLCAPAGHQPAPCCPSCADMIKRSSVPCRLQCQVKLGFTVEKLKPELSFHVTEIEGRRTKHRDLTLMLSFYFVCE